MNYFISFTIFADVQLYFLELWPKLILSIIIVLYLFIKRLNILSFYMWWRYYIQCMDPMKWETFDIETRVHNNVHVHSTHLLIMIHGCVQYSNSSEWKGKNLSTRSQSQFNQIICLFCVFIYLAIYLFVIYGFLFIYSYLMYGLHSKTDMQKYEEEENLQNIRIR